MLAFGMALAGESVLKPLVERCDLIDDEIVGKATGQEARLAALRCMAGQIGPVKYVHATLKNSDGGTKSTSFGTTLSEDRARQLGGPKVPPPTGKYESVTPAGFDAQFRRWIAKTKSKDSDEVVTACAEIGATIFLDAQPKKDGYTEQRMFKCFKLAGDAGNADAKFMTGVCLYYGIGCTRSKKQARAALQDWKSASGTTKANRGGWVARRFAEINK